MARWLAYAPVMMRRMARAPGGQKEACRILAERSKVFLGSCGIEIEVAGTPPPPGTGGVLSHNETSLADVFAITVLVLEHCERLGAADIFAKIPFSGPAMENACIEIVTRGNRAGTEPLMARMVEKVRGGERLLWGGEGRLSGFDGVARFKTGASLIAIRGGVPIWPIAVYGGHGCLPAGSTEVRPGRIRVRFCPPVSTEGLGEEDARALADRVQAAVVGVYGEMGGEVG